MNDFGYHKERHYSEEIIKTYKYRGVEFNLVHVMRDGNDGFREVWQRFYTIDNVAHHFSTQQDAKNYIKFYLS